MKDGADHLLTVTYDNHSLAICPVRAVEQHIQIGTAVGWDMTKEYMFRTITGGPGMLKTHRGTFLLPADQITQDLQPYAAVAEVPRYFSLQFFRFGGAISQELAGESLASII